MKIILVDDEKGIIDGLKIIIKRYIPECEVIGEAFNGIEGVKLILGHQPDIVITDIRMPQVDGLEMIKQLKDKDCRAKIILLSGYADFEYARKGMYLGVRYYLNKPVEEEELRDCVYELMDVIRAERNALEDDLGASVSPSELIEKMDVIEKVKVYLSDHYNESIGLEELSARFFINPFYLSQLFKQKTGDTYLNFLTQIRIDKGKGLLEKTDLKVYEICQMVGYSDTQYFSRLFEKLTGFKPSEYRKQHKKSC